MDAPENFDYSLENLEHLKHRWVITEHTAMLEIQRWKVSSEEDLRAEGLTDREIRSISERKIGAFRPAFKNGRHVREREGDDQSFYDRVSKLQLDKQGYQVGLR
jgi:hypothetical protein